MEASGGGSSELKKEKGNESKGGRWAEERGQQSEKERTSHSPVEGYKRKGPIGAP